MSNEELIENTLAENILTCLCFDTPSALLIANTVEPGLFENDIYKSIAKAAIEFVNSYKEAPKEHTADLLDSFIKGNDNQRQADLYSKVLVNLYQFKDNINTAYVIKQIQQFVHRQTIKHAILTAAHKIEKNDLEGAETTLLKGLKHDIKTFEPGIVFADYKKSLRFFDDLTPPYLTGIKAMDRLGVGPAKKELFIILAPANRGKSSFMIMLGKFAVLQRLKVLHITLEMSELRISQRYYQSFFNYAKRKEEITSAVFQVDELNRMSGLRMETRTPPALDESNARKTLEHKIQKIAHRIKLVIKEFPTGALTIPGLESYLDYLERYNHFMPDMILVDYADIMKLDTKNLRIDTGQLYKELRRIAVERDIAMVTASQSNRAAEDARIITMKHFAEDYSKAGTADNIVAFCQTPAESTLNLGRLFIAKARNEKREQTILLSQSYATSQFCTDSHLMSNSYWHSVDRLTEQGEEQEENQEEQPTTQQRARLPARRNIRRRD